MLVTNEFMTDRALLGIRDLDVEFNADLTDRTSMGTHASAAVLATPRSPRALLQLVKLVRQREWPMLILSGGSNMIFATRMFEGIVVCFPRDVFGGMHYLGDNMVRVGTAAELGGLLAYVRRCNLMGLEFCTMIPGHVGGALAGNAGAGNWGLCDFVERVLVMTRSGRVINLERGDFRYSYRYSELSEGIILEADLLLEPLNPRVSKERSAEYIAKKKGQPYKDRVTGEMIKSSGCVFKNPRDSQTGQKISAGKLIDEAGLKGYGINSVEVSKDHANFIINKGDATGEDFLAMINLVRDIVFERYKVELQMEAKIVGGPLTSCILR